MTTTKIVTLQVEVEVELNEGITNKETLAKALEKLDVQALSKIAKVENIRNVDELNLSDVSPGLIIEHEKYGLGIVMDVKLSRKYPMGVIFANGKSYNFATTNGFKTSDASFDDARWKNKVGVEGYYPLGMSGYVEFRGKVYQSIVAPTTSRQKYKLVLVYSHPNKAPGFTISVPTNLMITDFKEEQ